MNKSAWSTVNYAGKRLCLLFALVVTLTAFSGAQLSDTATSENYGCTGWTPPRPPNATLYSNWAYTDSAGKHVFTGSDYTEVEEEWYVYPREAPITCGVNLTTSFSAYSTDGLYYLQATGGQGTTSLAGYVNPKFRIVGVMYAPPGSKSTVTYADNNVVGASTSFSTSFSNGTSNSISVAAGGGIFGFTNKVTTTSSSSYTQEEDSSTSVAISQTTTSSTGLSGFSDPINGINHDYDNIFVWLNPLLTFILPSNSTGSSVVWTGYGYDLNDTPDYPDMDVVAIELGCLNGDFYQLYESNPTANPQWLTCEDVFNNNFSRTWALKNTDGSGPGPDADAGEFVSALQFLSAEGDRFVLCVPIGPIRKFKLWATAVSASGWLIHHKRRAFYGV